MSLHIRAPQTWIGLGLTLLVAGCGGGTGTPGGPTTIAPVVTGVSPNAGSTLGGTAVTINGSNFGAAATVTIGGTAATDVTFVSASSLTAKTPAHAAGGVDVIVSVSGQTGRLAGAFTYEAAPPTKNSPPVVKSIEAKGTRPNEPAQFADLDEEVLVTANVEDAETPISQLTFEWSAPTGTFAGQGASVTWKAPAQFTTPAPVTVSLVVTEKYQSTDSSGLPVTLENKVTSSTVIQLHDSEKEVGDMARQFLLDFADSSVAVSVVMRNFTPSCAGTAQETEQVTNNRKSFEITASKTGEAATKIAFDGRCPYNNIDGDACAQVPVEWHSIQRSNGETRIDIGTDQVAAVYQGTRWWLCDSSYNSKSCTGSACTVLGRAVTFIR